MQHLTMIMLKNNKRRILLILLLTMTSISQVLALPDDKLKTLELSSNSADLNQEKKQGEYLGEVILDQGTTHLRAVRAITNTDKNNKLVSAFAYGNPELPEDNPSKLVHFWTQTALDKPPLHAYADLIRYYPEEHRIELIGHARVEQGTESLAAETIIYDTLTQHVITKGNPKNRTVIVFHPEKHA